MAAALLVVPQLRTQMWYVLYVALGQALALCLLLRGVFIFHIRPVFQVVTAVLVALMGLGFMYRGGYLEGPRGYPHDMTWGGGMVTESPHDPYLTEQERMAVRKELLAMTATADRPLRAIFFSRADAMFFLDTMKAGIFPIQPIFHDEVPDVYVWHENRYFPKWVREYGMSQTTNIVGNAEGREIWSDGQRRWVVYLPENPGIRSKP